SVIGRTLRFNGGAAARVVSVPMILGNVEDYWFSTVVIHLEQPFRSDSMSYLAWLGDGERPGLPTWTGFLLLFPTAAAVMWRLGRSTATYVTTLAVMYFVFFLFSKQAFVHYYHFVMGTLVIAAVAWTAMAEARAGRGELRRRPIAEQSVPLQVA
ncbi:MAG: hypothetical protein KY456_10945, partial [Chloroflexi bacterium]|nr:hypothetical protein [Chloroflexota bacterium]